MNHPPGTAAAEPWPASAPLTALRAGPLSLFFEHGALRNIRLGSHELVRRIYVAVRDRNWVTVPTQLAIVHLDARADAFDVICEAVCRLDEIDFFWRGTIRGETSGRISFTMQGEARSTFLRNRIGFCILHPPKECRGARCRIGYADGATLEGNFPPRIAPENPFRDFTRIEHDVNGSFRCRLDLEGDEFEMEDQRNWADASFKTFSTPLRRPFPIEVAAGTTINQSVVLTLEGKLPASSKHGILETHGRVFVTLADTARQPLPPIGLATASHNRALTVRESSLLHGLHAAHLRVDLFLSDHDAENRLRSAWSDAQRIGTSLEIALFVSENAESELATFAQQVARVAPDVCRWLVFHRAEPAAATARWCQMARSYLAPFARLATFGTGTDHSFVEINRCRPPASELDFVCFSINPQVHAFDNLSLVETLETLSELVESARAIAGRAPLVVSPVTLKMRSNPATIGPERAMAAGELPAQVDPRQRSLLGAAWTLGCAKHLAEAGVASLTFYETTGWRGVMEMQTGSLLPAKFPSHAGEVFPVYHLLADISEFRGGEVVPCWTTGAAEVEALILEKQQRRRVLLANLSPESKFVTLGCELLGSSRAVATRLNEANVTDAMRSPLEFRRQVRQPVALHPKSEPVHLAPYEILRLDSVQ